MNWLDAVEKNLAQNLATKYKKTGIGMSGKVY